MVSEGAVVTDRVDHYEVINSNTVSRTLDLKSLSTGKIRRNQPIGNFQVLVSGRRETAAVIRPEVRSFGTEPTYPLHYGRERATQNETTKRGKEGMFGRSFENLFNLNFGPVHGDQFKIAMTPQGPRVAIKNNEGDYLTFDAENESLFNVLNFAFGGRDMFYMVPVTEEGINPGDVVLVKGKPVFLHHVMENGNWRVINPASSAVHTHINPQNILGFRIFTKIVSISEVFGAVNPAEGMDLAGNPLLAMAMIGEGGIGESNMLNMLLLTGQLNQGGDQNGLINLLLMSQLVGRDNGRGFDPKMLLLMGGNLGNINPMMLLAMSEGEFGMKDMLLFNALGGQKGEGAGNLFGNFKFPSFAAPAPAETDAKPAPAKKAPAKK